MELKEFISSVLNDIFSSIQELQKAHCPQKGTLEAIVSPSNFSTECECIVDDIKRNVLNVHFDVQLSIVESIESERGIKGTIKVLSGGVNKNSGQQNIVAQNVKFDIPVVLPAIETMNKKNRIMNT